MLEFSLALHVLRSKNSPQIPVSGDRSSVNTSRLLLLQIYTREARRARKFKRKKNGPATKHAVEYCNVPR